MALSPARSGVEERLELILEEQRKINALLQELINTRPQPKTKPAEVMVSDTSELVSPVAAAVKRQTRRKGTA